MKRTVSAGLIVCAVLLVPAVAASAHPLGNFTVNRYAGLRIGPDRIQIHYVVDMAEIPTFQERRVIDSNRDGVLSGTERAGYAARTCARLAERLAVVVDNTELSLVTNASAITFPPGAAGLPTTRLECAMSGRFRPDGSAHAVVVRDGNYAGRIGWREITANPDGTTFQASSVPRVSASAELTAYPQDLLSSPPAVTSATVRFTPGGAIAAHERAAVVGTILPRGVDRATQAFTSFIARRHVTVAFFGVTVALAILLGAVHALAPGHGKTVMAAYLLGEQGSFRQGAIIGLTVTVTHTAGVVLLGVIVAASSALAPERLYPFLGALSGGLMLMVGAGLLRRALRTRRQTHDGDHDHEDDHAHPHREPSSTSLRSLIGVGFAGGLVPSPSALVVLLGAIALGRVWAGLVLVVCYGLGMAATLSGAGLLLVKVRGRLERRHATAGSSRLMPLLAALPVATALIVCAVGLALTARGVAKI